MKKQLLGILISITFFCIGCSLSVATYNSVTEGEYYSEISFKEIGHNFSKNDFVHILVTNIIVLIIILYGGFFTCGILSSLTLLWNGFVVTLVFIPCIEVMSFFELTYAFALHGTIELFVFFRAALLSYGSISFFKGLMNSEVNLLLIPKLSVAFKLISLLVISAFIESIL